MAKKKGRGKRGEGRGKSREERREKREAPSPSGEISPERKEREEKRAQKEDPPAKSPDISFSAPLPPAPLSGERGKKEDNSLKRNGGESSPSPSPLSFSLPPSLGAFSWRVVVWLSLGALVILGDAPWLPWQREGPFLVASPETQKAGETPEETFSITGRVITSEGNPVLGAEIKAVEISDTPQAEPLSRLALSGPDGRFTLPSLPKGRFSLFARTSLGLTSEEIQVESPKEDVTLVIPEGESLWGRVYDADTLLPVPFARVRLGGSGLWPPQEAITNAEGLFSFPGVPDGIYTLAASGARSNGVPLASPPLEGITVKGSSREESIDIAVEPAWVLRGALFTESGEALRGAQVLISEDPYFVVPRRLFSDEIGVFSVEGVLSGEVFVRVLPESAPPSPPMRIPIGPAFLDPELSLPSPEDPEAVYLASFAGRAGFTQEPPPPTSVFSVEILLPEGQVVSGVVTDEEGEPVPGVLVLLHDPRTGEILGDPGPRRGRERWEQAHFGAGASLGDPSSFVTNSEGRFTIFGIREGEVVAVAMPSGERPSASTTCGDGVPCHLVLRKAGEITGRVVDEKGFPVAFASLRALPQGGKAVLFTESDERGFFRLAPVGSLTDIRVRAEGYGPRWVRGVAPGEKDLEIVLVVHEATLAGRIVDRKGFPVGAARVEVAIEEYNLETLSAEDGTFSLERLPKGEARVRVTREGYAPVETRCEGESCEITLLEGGRLSGRVLDEDGNALPFVQIEFVSEGATVGTFSADGSFLLGELPPGPGTLTVTTSGYVTATRSVTIREGEEESLEIELVVAGALRGKIFLESGAPAQKARVVLRGKDGDTIELVTGRDGAFFAPALPPGRWEVLAQKGDEGGSDTVDVEEGETTSFQLTLRAGEEVAPPPSEGEALGMTFVLKNGAPVLTRVRPGSPAAAADLRVGDVIDSIDAVSTSRMSVSEIKERLLTGRTVLLTVLPGDGGDPFDVEISP